MSISDLLAQLESRNIKLQVIDGKLKVFDVDGRLDNQLLSQLKNHKPELLQIFSQSKGFTPSDFPFANLTQKQLDAIEQKYTGVENIYPAVPMQAGMLFHGFVDGSGKSYTTQTTYELQGQFNVDAFRQAWAQMAERHAIFRTCFVGFETQTINQLVLDKVAIPFEEHDFSHVLASQRETALKTFCLEDKAVGFDFSKAPLMRLSKINVSDDHFFLVWTHHHSLLDAWCSNIVFTEVMQCYDAILLNQVAKLPATPDYESYIKWLEAQDEEAAQAYWQKYLAGFSAPNALVIDKLDQKQNAQQEDDIGRVYFTLGESFTSQLKHLSGQNGNTMNSVFQAAWAFLLASFSGDKDVVFGATVSGRPASLPGVENMVGLFINSLPVRAKLSRLDTVKDLVAQLSDAFAQSEAFSYYPLNNIQKESEIPAGEPLFDSLINFSNLPAQEFDNQQIKAAADLQVLSLRSDEYTNYGLTFAVSLTETMKVRITYSKHRFDDEVVEQIGNYLSNILTQMSRSFEQTLGELSMLSDLQVQQVFAQREAQFAALAAIEDTLHGLFEKRAQMTPDNTAIRFLERKYSFKEFNQKTNQLASLLQQQGVVKGDSVGICLERSEEIPMAILAVLKLGANYVPVDFNYPKIRQQKIIQDASIKLVLTHEDLVALPGLKGVPCIAIDHPQTQELLHSLSDQNPNVVVSADDRAYVIYTSGSSGQPKGVAVSHRSICRYVDAFRAQLDYLELPADTPWLWHVSYTFDASLKGIAALTLGSTVTLASEAQCIDQFELLALLRDADIKVFNATPLLMQHVLDAFEGDKLHLILSGDAISADLYKQVVSYTQQSGTKAINAYGPTELTVNASFAAIADGVQNSDIGQTVTGSHSAILSPLGNLLPDGIPGELAVCGDAVCQEYLNDPQRNESAFQTLSGDDKQRRYYLTGDRVCQSANNTLAFVGRRDHQLKIRGFRIELSEIEGALNDLNGIAEAVVNVKTDSLDNKVLVAYCTLTSGVSEQDRPRKEQSMTYDLAQVLPEHMIPSHFVILDEFPTTAAGKVDKKALPDPLKNRTTDDADAPATELEMSLLKLFKLVLKQDEIGVTDEFFSVGGDSILSMQLMAKAKAQGFHFTARQLLLGQSVRKLAALIESEHVAKAQQGRSLGVQNLLPVQKRFFDIDAQHIDHYNQSALFMVPAGFDVEMLTRAVVALVNRHDAMRLQFFEEQGEWYGRYQNVNSLQIKKQVSAVDMSSTTSDDLHNKLWQLGEEYQSSFDVREGLLFKAVYIDLGPDKDGRVAILFHHLIVDGVSWRIILSDLEQAIGQLQQGQNLALDPKTGSLQQWGDFLKAQVESGTLSEDRDYWLSQFVPCQLALPSDSDDINVIDPQNYGVVDMFLSEQETHRILASCSESELENVLLTAIYKTVTEYSQQSSLHVDMESHGRTWLETAPDVNGVVGWFTSLYPVYLATDEQNMGRLYQYVCQQRQCIPSNGFGYSALKYYGADVEIRNHLQGKSSNVVFNYLGKMDDVLQKDGVFKAAHEGFGRPSDANRKQPYQLSFNAAIVNGRLEVNLSYDESQYHLKTIESLAQQLRNYLNLFLEQQVKSETTSHSKDLASVAHDVLIPLNDSGASQNLFCLHPIGGYANHYLELAKGVEPFCQAWGLQAPDIFSDIQTSDGRSLASYYVELIQQQQVKGSYKLLGWSAGAKLAWEVACQLRAKGEKVDYVVSLDQSPALEVETTEGADFYKIQSFFGPKLKMDWQKLAQSPLDEAILSIATEVENQKLVNEGIPAELLSNYIRFLVCFPAVMATLPSQHADIDLHLLATLDSNAAARYDLNDTYNWDKVTSGKVVNHQVAGNHSNMVQKPYVNACIEVLQGLLSGMEK